MSTFTWLKPLILVTSLLVLSGCDTSNNNPTPSPTPISVPAPTPTPTATPTAAPTATPTAAPTAAPETNTITYDIVDPKNASSTGELTYVSAEELDLNFLKENIAQYDSGKFLMTVFLNQDPASQDVSNLIYIDNGFSGNPDGNNSINYSIQTPGGIVYKGSVLYVDSNDINLDFITDTLDKYTEGRFDITLSINEVQSTGSSSLKKTGQTTSYDEGGSVDSQMHDDGYYQAGTNRSYSRSNDIVYDLATALMWQDDANVLLVNKQWLTDVSYSAGTYDDTSGDTAATYCSQMTLGGYTDWRLPTIHELQSIVNYGTTGQAMDIAFIFKSSEGYWTSTSNSGSYVRGAWTVSFSLGALGFSDKNENKPVRCVRNIQQ